MESLARGEHRATPVEDVTLFRYSVPLRATVSLLPGIEIGVREGLLVRVTTGDGVAGWGEVSPLPGFSGHGLDTVQTLALDVCSRIIGLRLDDKMTSLSGLSARISTWEVLPRSLRFGIEGALVDNAAASVQMPPGCLMGADAGACLRNVYLVSATGSAQAVSEATEAVGAGYRILKLKVGRSSLSDDLETVAAVSDVVRGIARLRLDANRAWRLEEAAAFIDALEPETVDFVEEPLAREAIPTGLARLLTSAAVPIALDETLREATPVGLDEFPRIGVAVIKPSISGGIREALAVGAAARRQGIETVVSCAYESFVGFRMLVSLAAAISPTAAAGLGTYARLQGDVLTGGPIPIGPTVCLSDLQGAQLNLQSLERVEG